jgi:hypothetical protein
MTGTGFKHFFIPVHGAYMKNGMQTYFFLASCAFRSKVLVLVIVKKIRVPRSGIRKNSSLIRIPDPGGKKTPDPGYSTLL